MSDSNIPEYLLSIRKEPAEAILKCKKLYEFRKRFENYGPLAKMYLYVTAPHQLIIGHVTFGKPINGTPEELLKLLTQDTYDSVESLGSYFGIISRAFALPVLSSTRYSTPLTITSIRKNIPNFQPPMSYLKLTEKHKKIREMIHAHNKK